MALKAGKKAAHDNRKEIEIGKSIKQGGHQTGVALMPHSLVSKPISEPVMLQG